MIDPRDFPPVPASLGGTTQLWAENDRRLAALAARGVDVSGLREHWLEVALAALLGPPRLALVNEEHAQWVSLELDKVEGQVRESMARAEEEQRKRRLEVAKVAPALHNGRRI